jgi:hypothetical protein
VDNRSLENDPFRAVRYDFTTQTAGLDGRWRFGPEIATTLGFNWERWDRNEHREVPTTDEYGGKLAVDVTPLDWLLARLTYRPSFRRISNYNTFAHLIHSSIETDIADAAAVSQSILLRKLDEADRDRQRVDLLLELTPTDVITVTPTASYWRDDYNNSPLGLQKAESWSAGFDVSWAPVPWLIATTGYVYEENEQQQLSRSRP